LEKVQSLIKIITTGSIISKKLMRNLSKFLMTTMKMKWLMRWREMMCLAELALMLTKDCHSTLNTKKRQRKREMTSMKKHSRRPLRRLRSLLRNSARDPARIRSDY
jgi:hypothetical protein